MPRAMIMTLFATFFYYRSAYAAPPEAPRASVTNMLVACRALTAPDERLACYDREVARFERAEQTQQIIVIDRSEADATKRGLFGFKLPKLRLLGAGPTELSQIDAVVAGVKRDADNRISFTLQDGAKWHQIDDRAVSLRMVQGTKVKIERAALGSFFATFDKFGSIRVKRED